jgi:glycosyltransferase involved in cell wall biosynthesis
VATQTPSLSVVIPVYNEPVGVVRAVESVVAAVQASPFRDSEIVIVDDGSDEDTQQALAAFHPSVSLRIHRQPNAGRFKARVAGIRAANKDFVLLLDSRVTLEPSALSFVAPLLTDASPRVLWNGHVETEVEGNPYARFWRVPSALFWSRYLSNPQTTSFGVADFDWFPKGTGCFLAPRSMLLEALESFSSHYEDLRHANDDTLLLRTLARRERINISPDFAGMYVARPSLGPFLRHAFHRGTVFFDAFARPGTRFFPFLVVFLPASAIGAALLAKQPKLALVAALAAPPAAGAAAVSSRSPWRDVVAFAVLAPPFTLAYTGGIWRGAILALTAKARRLARRLAAGKPR